MKKRRKLLEKENNFEKQSIPEQEGGKLIFSQHKRKMTCRYNDKWMERKMTIIIKWLTGKKCNKK